MEVDDGLIVAATSKDGAMADSTSVTDNQSASSIPVCVPINHSSSFLTHCSVKRRVQELERCLEGLKIQESPRTPEEEVQGALTPRKVNGFVSYLSSSISSS